MSKIISRFGGLFSPPPALANGLHIPICAPFAALAATKIDSPNSETYFRHVPPWRKKLALGARFFAFSFGELPGLRFLPSVFGLAQTVFRFFRPRGRHFLTPDSAMPGVVMLGGAAGWQRLSLGFQQGCIRCNVGSFSSCLAKGFRFGSNSFSLFSTARAPFLNAGFGNAGRWSVGRGGWVMAIVSRLS
jgi:hypothetical protein